MSVQKPAGPVPPYFDLLLARLEANDPAAALAFGRHVHWGCWQDPDRADGSPEDYARAAETMCRLVCDASGIRDGSRLLDVGCGFGGTIDSLNERFRKLDMTGLNIDSRQLERARATVHARHGNRITFIEGDACRLPFPDASFDVVLAVECVFHFPSRERFLREAVRVLKPGGTLALSDFVSTERDLPMLQRVNAGANSATRESYGRVDLLCSPTIYRTMADGAGLAIDHEQDVTDNTLPTYPFLRSYIRAGGDAASTRDFEKATVHLEMASRMGWLRYTILGFRKAA